MKLLILSIILVGFSVFALCFNIIFRKNGKFPDGEISHNKELKKKGLQCAKVEEKILWHKNRKNITTDSCNGCMGDCTK